MLRTRIVGTGFVTGEHRVINDALSQILETSDAWIRERTGVTERYYVEEGTATSDLGVRAAEKAITDAGIDRREIDFLVFATMTPDYYFPGCGGLAQAKLGLGHVPALDIRQQCSGFIYGLQTCDALLRSGVAKTILFMGAEVHSGFMPWDREQMRLLFGQSDQLPTAAQKEWNSRFRDRAVLFGDAGAAIVLRAEEGERGLVGAKLHADGSAFEQLYVPAAGFAYRPYLSDAQFREGRYVPVMNGRGVFKMAVTRMPDVIRELCQEKGVALDDIDLLIPHQANLRISEAVQKALGLPDEKVFNNIQRYGNTTAASIPIAYHECRKAGRIKPGDLVCFVAMGAGFHWAAALMRE